jgi:hypothetical protein
VRASWSSPLSMQWLLRDHHTSNMPEVRAGALPATPPANVTSQALRSTFLLHSLHLIVSLLYVLALDHTCGAKPAYWAVGVLARAPPWHDVKLASTLLNLLVSFPAGARGTHLHKPHLTRDHSPS